MKRILLTLLFLGVVALPGFVQAGALGHVTNTATANGSAVHFFSPDANVYAVTTTSSSVIPTGIEVLKVIPFSYGTPGSASAFTLWDLPKANPVTYSAQAKCLGTYQVPASLGNAAVVDFQTQVGNGQARGVPIQGRLAVQDASGATSCALKVLFQSGIAGTGAQPAY